MIPPQSDRPVAAVSSSAARRVTIMDVARAAGLSRSATAYALRDDHNSSRETRARVQRIAKELGYRADPILSKLMSHLHSSRAKSYIGKIAFINADANRDFVQITPALSSFFADAAGRARELGYEPEPFWLHEPGRSQQRLARMLMARGIRGVVVGDMETHGRLAEFPWQHFSSIVMGYSVLEPALTRVVPHHYRNTIIALERVLAAGYRRPGLLTLRRQEDAMAKLHIAAFLAYQEGLPPENRVALMNGDTMTPKTIRTWFEEQKPDVILTTNYPAKIHFKEAGIRVPKDVALVTLLRWDNEEGMAGVRPLFDRLGTVAVNLLASQLQHDERGVPANCVTVEMEGAWTGGQSMPQVAGRGAVKVKASLRRRA